MYDMKCKKCKNEIPDGSIFCNWCGARQIRERKVKNEISVPAPRQLKSGKYIISATITDFTDTISFKMFVSEDDRDPLLGDIGKGRFWRTE